MNFLVLGCNGMAGHTISLYLKEQGHKVFGFDRAKSVYVDSVAGDARDTLASNRDSAKDEEIEEIDFNVDDEDEEEGDFDVKSIFEEEGDDEDGFNIDSDDDDFEDEDDDTFGFGKLFDEDEDFDDEE